MKIWISKRVPYFVGILSRVGDVSKKKNGVGDVFLLGCPQDFFKLNVKFRGISQSHKNLVQR